MRRARRARRLALGVALTALARVALARADRASIAVVGSVNADVIARVGTSVPRRGETRAATAARVERACGGKGANQAVAASRLTCERGGKAAFVGRFGEDEAGTTLRRALRRETDVSGSVTMARGSGIETGMGFVMLTDDGSPSAVVVGGANALGWNADDEALASEFREALRGAKTVMLQREVPERVNVIAATVAREIGVRTIVLDAGGSFHAADEALLALVDYVAPNESELAGMAGMRVEEVSSGDEAVVKAARIVAGTSRVAVLCTLGSRGSLLVRGEDVTRVEAMELPAGAKEVDATAAGDAFRAAFAVAMAENKSERDAMKFASAAGALAVTKLGAMPSLPFRSDVDEFLGVSDTCRTSPISSSSSSSEAAIEALRFASRLNSMKSRADLFTDAEPDVPEVFNLIKRMGRVQGVHSVFLNYPEHFIGPDGNELAAVELRDKILAAKLRPGAVCVRFPEEPFRLGAFSNPDGVIREHAATLARKACATATALDADEVVIWPRYDGYDYNLQADYATAWEDMIVGYKAVASSEECRSLKLSVEFKPTDEKSRFSFIPTTGAALLLVDAVGEPNFGLTLDVGHALAAGENPAQSIAMAASRNALFGVQLGDGHTRLGAEDGLMFASVHPHAAMELVRALRRISYAGVLYFDTFPLNEDPVAEAERNARVFRDFYARIVDVEVEIEDAIASRDAIRALDAASRM